VRKNHKEEKRSLNMSKQLARFLCIAVISSTSILLACAIFASTESSTMPVATASGSQTSWWLWPLILFPLTFILGILAVLGGIGGGVLFVTIVSGFFPFHIDFVRGAGLIIALSGSISAGPRLLKNNLVSLRLALPVALIASSSAMVGAFIGLTIPPYIDETLLGAIILVFVMLIFSAKKSDFPDVPRPDNLSQALGIMGIYRDESLREDIRWHVHRTPLGLASFIVIGLMAGMFGLGAGWANVPAFNLLMGAPIKISVATSNFLISITDTPAAWVYINSGAVLPIITIPSVLGMILGSRIGAKIFVRTKPKTIKWFVIGLLLFAGIRILLKGLAIWK
jgi:uncharacterized membrane protein YfcA